MPRRKSTKTTSHTNDIAVIVGKLQAQMDDQTRFRDHLMDIQQQQVRLLDEIKQEAKLANAKVCASIESLSSRLNNVEPVVKKLDSLRERGVGMLVMGLLAISLITSGIVTAGKTALRFFGIDLS